MLLFRVLGNQSLKSWLEIEGEKYSRWPDQLEVPRVEVTRNLVMAAKLAKEDTSDVMKVCLNGESRFLFLNYQCIYRSGLTLDGLVSVAIVPSTMSSAIIWTLPLLQTSLSEQRVQNNLIYSGRLVLKLP